MARPHVASVNLYRKRKHAAKACEAYEDAYQLRGAVFWDESRNSIAEVGCYYDRITKEKKLSSKTKTVPLKLEALLGLHTREEKVGHAFLQGNLFYQDQRHNVNLHAMCIMVFDVDHGMTFAECADRLEMMGCEAVIFTTFNHRMPKGNSPPCDRFRVVLFLDTAFVFHDIEEQCDVDATLVWKALYGIVGGHFQLPFDAACSDPARLFFYHSCPPHMKAEAKSITLGSQKLSLEPFLASAIEHARASEKIAMEKREAWRARQQDRDEGDIDSALKEAVCALGFIPACAGYRDWRNVIYAFHSEFAGTDSEDDAINALVMWSATCADKFEGDGEIIAIWESADSEGGITLGTLYALACVHGYSREKACAAEQKKQIDNIKKALELLND